MTYDTTNRGTLGKNTRKTEDTHPDLSGSLNVDGHDYWLNGFKKTNKSDGSTFYSLTVKRKDGSAPPERRSGSHDDDDGSIPF